MPEPAVLQIVRVAVLSAAVPHGESDGGGRLTEVALPAELPLREVVPAIRRIVSPGTRGQTRRSC